MSEMVKRAVCVLLLCGFQAALASALVPAVIFSDNVRVRSAPSVSSNVVGSVGANTLVSVFESAGDGEFRDGLWDRWYQISQQPTQWVNAAYVALFPFVIRVNGEYQTIVGAQTRSGETWLIPGTINLIFPYAPEYQIHEPLENSFPARGLLRDNPELRLSQFCLAPLRDHLPVNFSDNTLSAGVHAYINENSCRITSSWQYPAYLFEMSTEFDIDYPYRWQYAIAQWDTLETLRLKIGIESLPVRFRISAEGGSWIELVLDGTTELSLIHWSFMSPESSER